MGSNIIHALPDDSVRASCSKSVNLEKHRYKNGGNMETMEVMDRMSVIIAMREIIVVIFI